MLGERFGKCQRDVGVAQVVDVERLQGVDRDDEEALAALQFGGDGTQLGALAAAAVAAENDALAGWPVAQRATGDVDPQLAQQPPATVVATRVVELDVARIAGIERLVVGAA
jgi:hypothetical protein